MTTSIALSPLECYNDSGGDSVKIDGVEYVTTMEAVAILGVTQQRVRKMLQDKVIKGRKVGRDWMIEKRGIIERKKKRA